MIKEIKPFSQVNGAVYVPGSKSVTHRLLFISALALGTSTIRDVLYSEDTIYTMEALKKLGIEMWEENGELNVKGTNGKVNPPQERTEVYVGNSGTTARFLCSFAALSKKEVLITGNERLKERPMEELLRALMEGAVEVRFLEKEWHLPVIIKGPMVGGLFLFPKAPSSQFISSLLMVGPCLKYGMELVIKDPPYSKPYIRLTLEMMRRYGINYGATEDLRLFRIPPQPYRAKDITVEGDASSAAYFWAAAAVTGGKMSVVNVYPHSKQPDIGFLNILEKMGCTWERDAVGLTVKGTHELVGVDVDMNDMPDQVPTLAVLALFARGKTIIRNAAKEPEIVDLAKALRSAGALIEGAGSDTIEIQGIDGIGSINHKVMPDRIEAGTFIAAIATAGGEVEIKDFPSSVMKSVVDKFTEAGLDISIDGNSAKVKKKQKLRSVDIVTQVYPGFPTDMQAQFMASMCLAGGTSIIKETVFENRFMHVLELQRLGANIKIEGNSAIVKGVEKLIGAKVMATDLRASASLVIAGLAAENTTEVYRIYHLDRGYENLEKKLKKLGANIRREKSELPY